jgi:hypothetical protein
MRLSGDSCIGEPCGRLEVVNDAAERLVDAEQLAFEQFLRARGLAVAVAVGGRRAGGGHGVVLAEPAEHVPQVFVAGAGELAAAAGQHGPQELTERAGPVLCAVEPAVRAQGLDEALAAALRASSGAV